MNLAPPLCLVHLLAHLVAAEWKERELPEDLHSSKSVVLFQLATLPSKVVRPNISNPEHPNDVELMAMLTEVSRKVATALCVLGLVVLLALYFVWGGSVDSLKENPYGELKGTGERAGREAQERFQKWQEQRQQQGYAPPASSSHPGSPVGFVPDSFATRPEDGGFRRQFQGCC
eukprot:CAMPEP_0114668760 /NCGR_PEP_ID=MMETSP0191-20121206/36820_1 /TAXON_ID=126664 /ORGANISM="Sorites sp." /LENGTH=173 /DNA_ID=CAMNT_0001922605 /DNA_START=29 /DNA_END=550 /DNA_ORIENTATION=-